MNEIRRCTVIVKHVPTVVYANNAQGRDFAYLQECGRPVDDGEELCPTHLRLRARVGESRWQRVLELMRR